MAIAVPSDTRGCGNGRRRPAAQHLYQRIEDTLRQSIKDGTYGPEDRLPSESELMAAFTASRVTVRQALQALQAAGLVLSRQGRGYFVLRPKAEQDLGRLQGLGESVATHGHETHSQVLSLRETPATRDVARALQLVSGETVVELTRLRFLNGLPLSFDLSYFPLDIGRALARHDLVNNDVFVLLERELGLALGIADLMIDVDRADAVIARHLGISEGDPVLQIERLTSVVEGRPVDFEYLVGRGDACRFRVRVPRW